MLEKPTVEVIVTSYNDGRFLDEAVASAVDLAQAAKAEATVSYSITDDGSTERRTVEILQRYERRGTRVLWLPHRGLGAVRNSGISRSTCDWYIALDADNRLRSTLINQLLGVAMASSKAGLVYGDAMRFGAGHGLWKMGPTDEDRLQRENHIDNCGLVRRSAWAAVGGYNERLIGLEDWDLWLRFLEHDIELTYVPGIVFDYRVRADSLTMRLKALGMRNNPTPMTIRKRPIHHSSVGLHPGPAEHSLEI